LSGKTHGFARSGTHLAMNRLLGFRRRQDETEREEWSMAIGELIGLLILAGAIIAGLKSVIKDQSKGMLNMK
jgi:hypothetical protein